MERNVCPYLGRPDDENTSLAFPSEGNFCHKASPASAVNRKHQADYCLTGQHAACPVFLARAGAHLPAALAAPQSRQAQTLKPLGKTILAGLALLIYLVSLWLGGSSITSRMLSLGSDSLSGEPQSQGSFAGLFGDPPPAQQPGEPAPLPRIVVPTAANPVPQLAGTCTFPDGWQAYTVQPTDSIFRLSILFRVSQEELMKANCLSSQVHLTPGSTVYVPVLMPTATATATQPVVVYQPVTPAAGDENVPEPTAVPTAQAITATPNTPDSTHANKPPKSDQKKEDKKDDKKDDGKGKGNDDKDKGKGNGKGGK